MGAWLRFQALLTRFYPRFLLPAEGRLGRGESPSSGFVSGGRLTGSSVSRSQGCPRLCPTFWWLQALWSCLGARPAGQTVLAVSSKSPSGCVEAWWLGSRPVGSDVSFPGLCLFSSPWGTGPSKKVPGQAKGSASLRHPAHIFPKCLLPNLASFPAAADCTLGFFSPHVPKHPVCRQ